MTRSYLFAFFVLPMVACGPAETFPPTNDAGTPTNDAGKTCDGACVRGARPGWDGPYLLWTGAEANAPQCADVGGGLAEVYAGYGYPDGSTICGACTCAPPSGSCEPPTTLTTAAASCAGDSPSVAHLSFDPPAGWTGTCTTENAIPAGKLCNGSPCVQSVTIAPLTMTQGGCLPIEPPNNSPPAWTTIARACAGVAPLPCSTHFDVCVAAPPGPEFKQCVASQGQAGLLACPPEYPNRSVFYPDPTPFCSPCACDAPTGSGCSGSIVISAGSVCSPPLLPAVSLNEKDATCADVPPGSALGSKSASKPNYHAGSCIPSGGKPRATVFCCQP